MTGRSQNDYASAFGGMLVLFALGAGVLTIVIACIAIFAGSDSLNWLIVTSGIGAGIAGTLGTILLTVGERRERE